MIDIFDKKPINLEKLVCHSGGAEGADTAWENVGEEYGVITKAYSYKTKKHESPNKIEISDDDYQEGVIEINKANKYLNRYGIHKYMNLLARNWSQVKYSDQIFAVGTIIKPGDKNTKGYYNKGQYDIIDGGTGYAVMMGVNNQKEIFAFDQIRDSWFRWSYSTMSFIEITETPTITSQNFAGIGSRELATNGLKSIRQVYEDTFKKIK
jgi:hypothetical protein